MRRRLTVRFAGALRSENPGMSNEFQVRTLDSEYIQGFRSYVVRLRVSRA